MRPFDASPNFSFARSETMREGNKHDLYELPHEKIVKNINNIIINNNTNITIICISTRTRDMLTSVHGERWRLHRAIHT